MTLLAVYSREDKFKDPVLADDFVLTATQSELRGGKRERKIPGYHPPSSEFHSTLSTVSPSLTSPLAVSLVTSPAR
jgi:hypothetical protein